MSTTIHQPELMKTFRIVDVWSNQTHTVNALNQEIALRAVANKVNHLALLVVSMKLI
jgi:hypothetical protein